MIENLEWGESYCCKSVRGLIITILNRFIYFYLVLHLVLKIRSICLAYFSCNVLAFQLFSFNFSLFFHSKVLNFTWQHTFRREQRRGDKVTEFLVFFIHHYFSRNLLPAEKKFQLNRFLSQNYIKFLVSLCRRCAVIMTIFKKLSWKASSYPKNRAWMTYETEITDRLLLPLDIWNEFVTAGTDWVPDIIIDGISH